MAQQILIYSVTFYPHQGGMEKNSELLAQKLFDINGGKVTLFTKSKLNKWPELNVPYKLIRSSSNLELVKEALKNDVIIINGGMSLPIAVPSILFGKAFAPIFQMAEIPGKPVNESKFKTYLKEKLLRKCKKIVGVSQACLDSRRVSKSKGEVIYNPIDPFLEIYLKNNELSPLKDRPIDLLFAGRMIKGKGIFILFDALIRLDATGLSLNVLFSGNGDDEKKLKALVAETVWKHITINFQDFVRDEKLAITYLNTKCMVLPSHSHTEGSPLSIAEALTFGSAVIHSDQPAMIEQTSYAGLSFTSGDSKNLSDTINALFQNKEWDKIMSSSLRRSTIFSSRSYEKRIKNLLGSLK